MFRYIWAAVLSFLMIVGSIGCIPENAESAFEGMMNGSGESTVQSSNSPDSGENGSSFKVADNGSKKNKSTKKSKKSSKKKSSNKSTKKNGKKKKKSSKNTKKTDSTKNKSKKNSKTKVKKNGTYTSKKDVAAYIEEYGELPDNYITKSEAKKKGWNSKEGNLDEVAKGKSIGGDRFGNFEKQLPDKKGRKWTEADIDYNGGHRNAKRIVFSNDGYIYYTDDHYNTFELLKKGED